MSDDLEWFAPKRYGYGSGLPISWQGWAVLVGFLVLAFAVSIAFLCSYVVYHAHHGSTPFAGRGWVRPFYFSLLVSHVLLAVSVVPLACVTLYRAWGADFARHRAIAVVTFPIWMYVSVTGVVVYWMLYHLYARVP